MAKILIGDHSKPESKAPEGRVSQGGEPPKPKAKPPVAKPTEDAAAEE
jgi:hypothetical protein